MANIAFQTAINPRKPWGVAGDFFDGNYNHLYPLTLIVKEGETVEVGKFVWDNANGTCSAIGTGQPTGVVHRTMFVPITDFATGATMTVPGRLACAIADKCSIFMNVSDVPTVGNKIFVNNTTGVITNAAAGTKVEGTTETSFRIISLCEPSTAAAAGALVGVTNWE